MHGERDLQQVQRGDEENGSQVQVSIKNNEES